MSQLLRYPPRIHLESLSFSGGGCFGFELPLLRDPILNPFLQSLLIQLAKNVHAEPGRKVVPLVLVQRVDPLHVLRRQLKVLKVGRDARRGDGFREHDGAALNAPLDGDLGRLDVVLGGDFGDDGVVDRLRLAVGVVAGGAVGSDGDTLKGKCQQSARLVGSLTDASIPGTSAT